LHQAIRGPNLSIDHRVGPDEPAELSQFVDRPMGNSHGQVSIAGNFGFRNSRIIGRNYYPSHPRFAHRPKYTKITTG
jgi:hypothetical protein